LFSSEALSSAQNASTATHTLAVARVGIKKERGRAEKRKEKMERGREERGNCEST